MNMRIKEISVKGLFGMFDHVIPLNMEENVTVIYGENGVGKTMVFRILYALLRQDMRELGGLPFALFTIFWENGAWLEVKNGPQILLRLNDGLGSPSIEEEILEKGIKRSIKEGARERFWKTFIDWLLLPSNFKKQQLFDELIKEEYGIQCEISKEQEPLLSEMLPLELRLQFIDRHFPSFSQMNHVGHLIEHRQKIGLFLSDFWVDFIGTDRLKVDLSAKFEAGDLMRGRESNRVTQLSNEMSQLMSSLNESYREQTEKLESTVRSRLSNTNPKSFQTENLESLYKEISNTTAELREVGLWEDQQESTYESNMSDVAKAILWFNLNDMKSKLAVYDDAKRKLRLFLNIINGHSFSFKSLRLHHEEGFVCHNSLDRQIALSTLSTGEQHQLIMMSQLIFSIPDNSVVLIDEPEISLNLPWQKAFIDDMIEIIKLRGFQIIIATHSPAIINGRWNMTCALKGEIANA